MTAFSLTKPGFFYPLTVIANAADDMRVVKEEQFGPVIPVVKYKTVEEARSSTLRSEP
jgi:acyl-CoA reductase-like NAD-dependent aldehyde dehydrogenase